MSRQPITERNRFAILLSCVIGTLAGPARGNDNGGDVMRGQLVKTGLYVIVGGGSNSILRLSASGLILVDGKFSGSYPALAKQVRKISDQPVRVLILTDHAESRSGTNAQFVKSGTQIVAQENIANDLIGGNADEKQAATPVKTYQNNFIGRLGGVEVQVMHFGGAHSSDDSVVYFPDLRAIAIGDLFVPDAEATLATGGSFNGWNKALEQILKLEFDVVVPGGGPVIKRAELQAFKAKINALVPSAVASND